MLSKTSGKTDLRDFEIRLGDIDERIQAGASYRTSIIRFRWELRKVFRIMITSQNAKLDPYIAGHLKTMGERLNQSFYGETGDQMKCLGEAISFGKLAQYQMEKKEKVLV